MKKLLFISFLGSLLLMGACGPEELDPGYDLTSIAYSPTNYNDLPTPANFPNMEIPSDNSLTEDGIYLGRMLFYDPILSADSTQSCSSCHHQANAFAEPRAVSIGIDGIAGTRNAMPLFNLGYNPNGFFWDGRSASLEIQALEPIENPIELHDTWENVEMKLQRNKMYRDQFRKAFGIDNSNEMTKDLAVKALSQFMRTMVSWRSKYDKVLGNAPYVGLRPVLSEAAERGRVLYVQELGGSADTAAVSNGGNAECQHCHQTSGLFTNNSYRNNGLDFAANFDDFVDKGFGMVTDISADNGKFRTPSLRNIELTGPYMHDGRFQTLEEVLQFYSEHIKSAPNIDSNLGNKIPGVGFSDAQIQDIIAFLKTLTDDDFINDPQFSSPF
jgi:cytochrome c peroxidase